MLSVACGPGSVRLAAQEGRDFELVVLGARQGAAMRVERRDRALRRRTLGVFGMHRRRAGLARGIGAGGLRLRRGEARRLGLHRMFLGPAHAEGGETLKQGATAGFPRRGFRDGLLRLAGAHQGLRMLGKLLNRGHALLAQRLFGRRRNEDRLDGGFDAADRRGRLLRIGLRLHALHAHIALVRRIGRRRPGRA